MARFQSPHAKKDHLTSYTGCFLPSQFPKNPDGKRNAPLSCRTDITSRKPPTEKTRPSVPPTQEHSVHTRSRQHTSRKHSRMYPVSVLDVILFIFLRRCRVYTVL